MRNKWFPYVKVAGLKCLFVYLKVRIFKFSYRSFHFSIFSFIFLVLKNFFCILLFFQSHFFISPVVASRCCSTLVVPPCIPPCWALLTCCIFCVVCTLLCVLFVALGFPSSEWLSTPGSQTGTPTPKLILNGAEGGRANDLTQWNAVRRNQDMETDHNKM